MPEINATTDVTTLIFRSQSGRTEVARRPDGTLHVSVLTGTDMLDWPELERLVGAARAAGRKQALREASSKVGDLLASWPAVPTFAASGIEHRFDEWAARIAEGGEPRG